MPVVDAIQAGAQAILPAPAPLGGALVEETALIARWLAAPGVRIVAGPSVDDDGWASPLRSAGRLGGVGGRWRARRGWPASRPTGRHSDLLAEPHPSREQLFGRTGVDGRAGTRQPVLPRRQPFSAAG